MTDSNTPSRPSRQGIVATVEDTALNDSDKTITVPAGEEWEVVSVFAELISTATVGNRQMAVYFEDNAAGVLGQVNAGAVQIASLTRGYTFAPGVNDQSAFVGTLLSTSLPKMCLKAGDVIRVLDAAAIDAAADDLTIRVQYIKR